MKEKWLRLANLIGVVVTIAINVLANALPLGGNTTGELSDRFQVYFVPAGYVFSIWGLIYLALIVFAVYQILPAQRENARLQRIGCLFVLSCLANCAWIFLWHYELFPWTLIAMFVLLLSLIAIYLRLGIGRSRVSRAETWCVRVPFSIYLGWVTVATVANVTSVLDFVRWGGWGINAVAWAVIMLLVATLIGCAVAITRGDVAYVLVLVWAFIGIAVKQIRTPLVWISAALAALLLLLMAFVGFALHSKPLPADKPMTE